MASVALTGDGPLEGLFEESTGVLSRAEMEFEPLLPDDETDLAARVEALGAWCQGFLYGFGAAGTAAHAKLPRHGQRSARRPRAGLARGRARTARLPKPRNPPTRSSSNSFAPRCSSSTTNCAGLRQGQPVSQSGH